MNFRSQDKVFIQIKKRKKKKEKKRLILEINGAELIIHFASQNDSKSVSRARHVNFSVSRQ